MLIPWAYKIGIQGESLTKIQEDACNAGHLLHGLIKCFVLNETAEIDNEFSESQVDAAEEKLDLFKKYWKHRNASLIFCEKPLIDHEEHYTGTPDLVVDCWDGFDINSLRTELWDVKSSKSIYPESYIQVEAYLDLLYACKGIWASPRIIHLPDNGTFDAPDISDETRDSAYKAWECLLPAYRHLHEGLGMDFA